MGVLRRFFHFEDRGTTFKNEILGGLLTFFAALYILPVESSMLAGVGFNASGVFFATALSTFAVSLLMGLFANYPLLLSSGMGLNAFFAYTVVQNSGLSPAEGMILIVVAGLLYLILTLTPVRRLLVGAIPSGLRAAITVGLGGFVLFVGLVNAGLVKDDPSTLLALGDFSSPGVLLASFGILLAFGLSAFKKVPILQKFALPLALFITAVVGVVASSILLSLGQESQGLPLAPWLDSSASWGVSGFEDVFLFGLFKEPLDWGSSFMNIFGKPDSYAAIFSIIFLSLFNATACLFATGKSAGLDLEGKDGKSYRRAMLVDGIASPLGGLLGTSSLTGFAESTVGISFGAKTGLSTLVAGLLFLLSGFLFPVFSVFSYSSVNAVALVYVGVFIMAGSIKEVAKEDGSALMASLLTLMSMVLTYSLSSGMAIGTIAYVVMQLFEGNGKKISWALYLLAALFVLSFALTAIF